MLLNRFFPFLTWFKEYDSTVLRADLTAGITVALVLIPQSMAYAQLAGLPAYYGLYAAFLPPMVAGLFGSSRQLATGPVAVVSLMTAAALEPIAAAGSQQYIAYAIVLALLVGVFQFALGVLRLGMIVNFLSHPVVNGFTNAAALIIATSQLPKIFGVDVDNAEHHYETVYRVIEAAVDATHWPSFAMAALAFGVMIGLKKLKPRIPNVLVAVVLATLLSWAVGFEKNVKIPIGRVESERARTAIRAFNEAVTELAKIEKLRTEGNTALEEGAVPRGVVEEEVCTNCHAKREPEFVWSPAPSYVPRSGSALALHHAAGLLDLRIRQLKEDTGELRAELRSLRFEAVEREAGDVTFYPAGETPRGSRPSDGLWHPKVGSDPLDEDAISLVGGGAVVASIPEGLPKIAIPSFNWAAVSRFFFVAMVISILGFMEAISIAKAMAARTQQRLDPDQELIGQGLANMIGCLGQSYAVSGSFSRSAVNLQAGALTGMSNVFSSCVVVVVLLFFTPLLYHLPQAVLAAVIMMAVFGLLNVEGFVHAWRAQKFDGFTGVATFVATLALAPHLEWGIALGVALSLGAYLYRTMRPPLAELSLHPDGSLRDADRHSLKRCRYIAAIRFDGPLNFANTSYLEDKVLELVSEMPELRHVLVAAHGINEIDASGEDMLRLLVERLRDAGYEVSFSGLKEEVQDALVRTGLYERIGEEHFFPTQALAVAAIYAKAHANSTETDCPLQPMRPRVADLSLHPDGSLRDAERYGLRLCKHLSIVRFEGSLDLASAGYLADKMNERVADMPDLAQVLIAAHRIHQVDVHGVETLGRLVRGLRDGGYGISFSGLGDNVVDTLRRYHLYELIGEDNIYPTQIQAVRHLYARAHAESAEGDECPLAPLQPYIAELSLHADGSLRDADRHGLKKCAHIAALRFDGPLDLASSEYLEKKVEECIAKMPGLKQLFFAAHRITQVDPFGAGTLRRVIRRLQDGGYKVSFSGFADDVLDELKRRGIIELIGENQILPTQIQAVRQIYAAAHEGSTEKGCPLAPIEPRVVELSMHPDGSLRDAARHGLQRCQHIAALRYDGRLDSAASEYLEQKVEERIASMPELRHVFFAAHRIHGIDPDGAEMLARLVVRLRQSGLGVSFSGFSDEVTDVLKDKHVHEIIGDENIYPTQVVAIGHIHAKAHERSVELECPLLQVVPLEPVSGGPQ